MKKLFTLLLSIAMVATTACESDDNNGTPDNGLPAGYVYADSNTAIIDGVITQGMLFFGTSTVTTIASGEVYTDTKANFELVSDGQGKARILMHETRFAAAMPALEMEVPGVPYTGVSSAIALAATSVVPEIKGTPYERYTMTALTGPVANTNFTLSFTCAGTFQVTYQGRLIIKG